MKNISYLTGIILFVIILILNNACDKDENINTVGLTGNWKVISFENYETSIKITKTEDNTWSQINNGDILVKFDKPEETSGVISGRNVTNSFSGTYTIDSLGTMTVKDVIWTEINEPEWGRLFHSIVDAESYELKNGNLIIFYNNKKNSITLEKTDK